MDVRTWRVMALFICCHVICSDTDAKRHVRVKPRLKETTVSAGLEPSNASPTAAPEPASIQAESMVTVDMGDILETGNGDEINQIIFTNVHLSNIPETRTSFQHISQQPITAFDKTLAHSAKTGPTVGPHVCVTSSVLVFSFWCSTSGYVLTILLSIIILGLVVVTAMLYSGCCKGLKMHTMLTIITRIRKRFRLRCTVSPADLSEVPAKNTCHVTTLTTSKSRAQPIIYVTPLEQDGGVPYSCVT